MSSGYINLPLNGVPSWRSPVALTSQLPLINNNVGDVILAEDTNTVYAWDGSAWIAIATPGAAIAIDALLGDVTATGPGAVAATLATVNLAPGTFGSASSVPVTTVNGKGLALTVIDTPIQISESQVNNLVSDLAGKQGTITLTTTGSSGAATLIGNTLNVPNYLAITSINSLVAASQTLVSGTSGTDFNISSATATHTFNLPTASAVNRGALSSADWTTFNNKLSKGTNTIFCIDNGDYATLQAAIDAAPSYPTSCTILVGAKSGGWGDIVIPANKNISITGMSSPKSEQVVFVNSVTYSPTTGTNPVANNVHLCNLFISPQTAIQAITFGGTAPARLRFTGCYVYGNAATSIVLNNSNAVYSVASFTDCYFDMGNTSNTHFSSTLRYVVIDRCNFNSGNKAFNVTAGFVQAGLSSIQVNSVNEIITVSGTNTLFSAANCLIQNSTTNGSGIFVGTGAFCQSINNIFNVATGTGYCVRGTGVHLYGQTTTANSILGATNVKMQNTLTNVPYTIGLTSSA